MLILVAAALAVMYGSHRYRVVRRRALAARHGMQYALRGLEELPAELQESVLFAVSDGGHERDVMSGAHVIAEHSVPTHIFSFTFQRDVRGEWGYLNTKPPFRLSSPMTVFAYELPREMPRLLIKREGASDDASAWLDEVPTGVVDVVRSFTAIDRAMCVEPPAAIGKRPLVFDDSAGKPDTYRVWGEQERAQTLLTEDIWQLLASPATAEHELVIELVGPLMLLYCASKGALSDGDTLAMGELGIELSRRLLRASLPSSPRGVEL